MNVSYKCLIKLSDKDNVVYSTNDCQEIRFHIDYSLKVQYIREGFDEICRNA